MLTGNQELPAVKMENLDSKYVIGNLNDKLEDMFGKFYADEF